jgi:hypothetical protein
MDGQVFTKSVVPTSKRGNLKRKERFSLFFGLSYEESKAKGKQDSKQADISTGEEEAIRDFTRQISPLKGRDTYSYIRN